MIRKTLTIFSLIGLLLSLWLCGVTPFMTVQCQSDSGWYMGAFQGTLVIGKAPAGRYACCLSVDHSWAAWGVPEHVIKWWPRFHRGILILPLWLSVLLFGGGAAVYGLPILRRCERKKLGLCLRCGYDLRGSTVRCPECGTEFEKSCSARP